MPQTITITNEKGMTITPIIGKEFPDIVIPYINKATKNIRVLIYDWRWYPNDISNPCQLFNNSIIRAAQRGVAVSAILNSGNAAKVLKENKCKIRELSTGKMLHTKFMLIDERVLIIGSHNYTYSAMTKNYEMSIVVDNLTDWQGFIKYFNSLF